VKARQRLNGQHQVEVSTARVNRPSTVHIAEKLNNSNILYIRVQAEDVSQLFDIKNFEASLRLTQIMELSIDTLAL
jgi:hypothetical protein